MRRIISILFAISMAINSYAQGSADSLYALYQHEVDTAMEYYWQYYDSRSAIPHFEKAYSLLEKFKNSKDSTIYEQLFCLNMLKKVYTDCSKYFQAEECINKQIDIYVNDLDTFNYSYASLLYDKAVTLMEVTQNNLAINFFNRAKKLIIGLEKSGNESNLSYIADIDGCLGDIYLKEGELDIAISIYTKLLDSEQIEKYTKADMIKKIGDAYFLQNKFHEAELYYRNALEQGALSDPILSQLGILCCKEGRMYEAEDFLVRLNPYPDDGYDASSLFFQLGTSYYNQGNAEKAEYFYEKYIEHIRTSIYYDLSYKAEKIRYKYWTDYTISYIEPIINFFVKQDDGKSSICLYDILLFSKAQLLFQQQAFQDAISKSEQQVRIKLEKLHKIQEQLIDNYFVSDSLSKMKLTIQESYIEHELLRLTWTGIFNREHIINNTCSYISEVLGSNEKSIEFFTTSINKDTISYYALLLQHGSKYPELIPLFEEKEPLSLINTTTENLTSKTYSYEGNGKELSQLVWSKILPYVKPGETIYFAPSGILHQLAIEALPYDESNTMGDMFNLVRLSSTREIVTRKDEFCQSSTATLYGGIQYNMDADELLAESEAYKAIDLLASRGIENDALNRGTITYLKGTKAEAENINAMLKQNNLQVQLFTAKNANEESFKALSGKHRNILHIATHGFYWSDSTAQKKDYFSQRMVMRLGNDAPAPPTIDPLNRCGLLFAGAQTAWSGHSADLPEGVQDGILTAKEISLLDLRDADLVVLSACETGKGEITGDGVFGLQRAFKQAGAQTIVMSLWPVNDAATQLLMTEFYRNWITNHQSKREAFRNAQNTVRSIYEEPVYWAGFIMLD